MRGTSIHTSVVRAVKLYSMPPCPGFTVDASQRAQRFGPTLCSAKWNALGRMRRLKIAWRSSERGTSMRTWAGVADGSTAIAIVTFQ